MILRFQDGHFLFAGFIIAAFFECARAFGDSGKEVQLFGKNLAKKLYLKFNMHKIDT